MKTQILDQAAILAKYPEKKPVCLNYAAMREELLALAEENEALRYVSAVLSMTKS